MMSRLGVVLGLCLWVGVAGVMAAESATAPMTQKTCPIMKEPVDAKMYADLHGYRLYTCCKKCQAKVVADPAKAMRALVAMGEQPQMRAKPQSTCPMTGEKISGTNFGVVDGMRVDFCCPNCEKKFDAMSPVDRRGVVDKMVSAGQAPKLLTKDQTECPMMGGKIDKKVFVDVNGDRTYFCCKGCETKYVADKTAMDKKLAAAGVGLERTPAPPAK